VKLLYITFEPPSNFSGGGLVVKQSIISLAEHYEIDYLGPEFSDEEVKLKVNTIGTLNNDSNKVKRVLNLFKGVTTGFYSSWLRERDKIEWAKYNSVFLEFSRHDFVATYVKKMGKKLIIRLHNVEYDYFKNIKNHKKNIQSILRFKFICRQEPECLSNADKIVCLTQKDKDRLMELYNRRLNNEKIEVVPVCVKKPEGLVKNNINNKEGQEVFLITGSFWYGPNSFGTIWFINNVWKKLQENNVFIKGDHKLILAGSSPNDVIKNLVSNYKNIELVDSPEDMAPYFYNANVYIAPIFSGAGMKVKVAEALSYGLPIVGTDHAFVGYEIEHGKLGFVANSSKLFVRAIEEYLSKNRIEKKSMKENITEKYFSNYSMTYSSNQLKKIVRSL